MSRYVNRLIEILFESAYRIFLIFITNQISVKKKLRYAMCSIKRLIKRSRKYHNIDGFCALTFIDSIACNFAGIQKKLTYVLY